MVSFAPGCALTHVLVPICDPPGIQVLASAAGLIFTYVVSHYFATAVAQKADNHPRPLFFYVYTTFGKSTCRKRSQKSNPRRP